MEKFSFETQFPCVQISCVIGEMIAIIYVFNKSHRKELETIT